MLTMRDEERKVLTASNDVARCKFFWGGVGTPSENINITKIVTIETNSKTEQQDNTRKKDVQETKKEKKKMSPITQNALAML
jgi:hypothetical protein